MSPADPVSASLEPRTEAGKALIAETWDLRQHSRIKQTILAIAEQAATEARRELRNAVNDYFGWDVMSRIAATPAPDSGAGHRPEWLDGVPTGWCECGQKAHVSAPDTGAEERLLDYTPLTLDEEATLRKSIEDLARFPTHTTWCNTIASMFGSLDAARADSGVGVDAT